MELDAAQDRGAEAAFLGAPEGVQRPRPALTPARLEELLDGIDGQTFYRQLVVQVPTVYDLSCRAEARRDDGTLDPGEHLAALLGDVRPARRRDLWLVLSFPPLPAMDPAEVDAVVDVLGLVGFALATSDGMAESFESNRAATPGRGLVMPDGLDLPLLDLAADLARREPSATLEVVTTATAAEGVLLGMFTRSPRSATVWLNVARHEAGGFDLADTWAHELAHGIDPYLDTRERVDRERYAETLCPLLLTHRPATVDTARALMAHEDPPAPPADPDFDLLLIAARWLATLDLEPLEEHP